MSESKKLVLFLFPRDASLEEIVWGLKQRVQQARAAGQAEGAQVGSPAENALEGGRSRLPPKSRAAEQEAA